MNRGKNTDVQAAKLVVRGSIRERVAELKAEAGAKAEFTRASMLAFLANGAWNGISTGALSKIRARRNEWFLRYWPEEFKRRYKGRKSHLGDRRGAKPGAIFRRRYEQPFPAILAGLYLPP